MTNDQITALAHEYAEKVYAEIEDVSLKEHLIVSLAKGAEDSFRFLLCRYCLVEKSKVLKSLIQARALIEVGRRNHDNIKEDLGTGSERTIYCLFPEIAKEVEG